VRRRRQPGSVVSWELDRSQTPAAPLRFRSLSSLPFTSCVAWMHPACCEPSMKQKGQGQGQGQEPRAGNPGPLSFRSVALIMIPNPSRGPLPLAAAQRTTTKAETRTRQRHHVHQAAAGSESRAAGVQPHRLLSRAPVPVPR